MRRVERLLEEFDEPTSIQPSRYDNWNETRLTSQIVLDRLSDLHETEPYETLRVFLDSASEPEKLDLLEVWYDELSTGEKPEFQRELNALLREEAYPWRFAEGAAFLIDSEFLNLEVTEPALHAMAGEQFAGALNEFKESLKDLAAARSKDAILKANKSLESVLQTVLGQEGGTASRLLHMLEQGSFFDDLPDSARSGMVRQVLMALPFLRNRLGGHGQGETVVNVPLDYARLAVHLAGIFNYFIIERYLAAQPATEASVEPEGDDGSIPF